MTMRAAVFIIALCAICTVECGEYISCICFCYSQLFPFRIHYELNVKITQCILLTIVYLLNFSCLRLSCNGQSDVYQQNASKQHFLNFKFALKLYINFSEYNEALHRYFGINVTSLSGQFWPVVLTTRIEPQSRDIQVECRLKKVSVYSENCYMKRFSFCGDYVPAVQKII